MLSRESKTTGHSNSHSHCVQPTNSSEQMLAKWGWQNFHATGIYAAGVENQLLPIWAIGPHSEKAELPCLGWEWGAASSGGVQLSQDDFHEWEKNEI